MMEEKKNCGGGGGGMSGIFSLVGENYRDSWYEPKKQDKNGNKD